MTDQQDAQSIMDQVRVRFAPSPTGSLHIGNLRVAIFNYLFARHHDGAFVVRIEDTDRERNVEGSLEGLLDDLRWAGLDWDEGPGVDGPFGPYRQSERGDNHRKAALSLEERGLAYRCFCSDEELAQAARDDAPEPGCPGNCRSLEEGDIRARMERDEPSTLRFTVHPGTITFRDAVRGDISLEGSDLGDFVILRADGRATYNFAVVVDDLEMKISHVIRGAGHLSNTPKQALLFDALDAPRPVFAHLPMVLGADKRKLSKREGAEGVVQLRSQGFHPDGVVNYLSLLGWSPGGDREILSRQELIAAMDLDRVGATDTVFDPEKLRWASAQHIAALSLPELVDAIRPWVDTERFDLEARALPAAVDAIRTRLTTFGEVNEHLSLIFPTEDALQAGLQELEREGDSTLDTLKAIRTTLSSIEGWEAPELGSAVRSVGKDMGVRGRALFHPIRLALTGSRQGPDLGKVLAALGRTRCIELLDGAILWLEKSEAV